MMKIIYLIPMLLCLAGASVRAVSLNQIDIAPMVHELSAGRNQIAEGTFTVLNLLDRPVTVSVSADDWFVQPKNKGMTANKWLSFEPQELEIAARQKGNVKCIVKVPKKAVGELGAKIMFTPKDQEGGMLVVKVSGSLYVAVSGTEKVDASIVEMLVRKQKDGYQCAVVLKNSGNVHLRPKGRVVISQNGRQLVVAELKHGWPVFPNAINGYFGELKETVILEGSYDATAIIELDDKGKKLEKKLAFSVGADGNVTMN